MKLQFKVGNNKKHQVEFTFSKFWGTIKLIVDGNLAAKYNMNFSSDTTYRCKAGEYNVEVKVVQGLLAAAFRKRSYEVYVNGELYKKYDDKGIEVEMEKDL